MTSPADHPAPPLHTWRPMAAWTAGILVALVLGWLAGRFWDGRVGNVTTSLLSPDGKMRAVLVEKKVWIDRNFRVDIEHLKDGRWGRTTVFSSPDEGRPEGSERFLWSRDGKWLLLVGRHFYAKCDATTDLGETPYLLYEVGTGRAWCNATQQSALKSFGAAELKGLGFNELGD